MTTEEQANADALWPEGTDCGGLKAMCYGLLSGLMQRVAIYIGCANARSLLRDLDQDMPFWQELSKAAPVIRDVLRQNDAVGKAMNDAERASRKHGAD